LTSGPTKAIKAAVLGRRYTIPFSGMTSLVFVEDLARIFIAAARSRPEGALTLNIRGELISIEAFIERLAGAVPGASGRIACSGPAVPIACDFAEGGLESLLGSGGIPRTPIDEGIRTTAERFRELASAGRLHDRDLAS
jgi:nucleoside-diphosphate-sugar epimerase